MTSIDLTDAYFSLPMAQNSRKYLRFQWRDMLLEFQCLCFGLSLAPYYFTKVMKPVFSQLRKEGIPCTFYLDDSLYLSRSYNEAKIHTKRAIMLLESLGFTINHTKSILEPTVEITHLGFKINSISQIISLPDEKVEKILTSCSKLPKLFSHKQSSQCPFCDLINQRKQNRRPSPDMSLHAGAKKLKTPNSKISSDLER